MLRPLMERLEDRLVLASLQIQNALLVDAAGLAITAPVIGEEVFLQANWITSGLNATNAYFVGFTIDGVTLPSGVFQGQTGQGLGFSTVVGGGSRRRATIRSRLSSTRPTRWWERTSRIRLTRSRSRRRRPPRCQGDSSIRWAPQSDWTIANYVDVNPVAGQAQDFMGGPYTFAGNTAMDFSLGDFGQMDAGYPVTRRSAGPSWPCRTASSIATR